MRYEIEVLYLHILVSEEQFQKHSENGAKSLKESDVWSSWVTSWRQDALKCELGRVLVSIFIAFGRYLGPKMGKIGEGSPKLAPRWAKLGVR